MIRTGPPHFSHFSIRRRPHQYQKRAFKQALDEKSFKEGRRITLNGVGDEAEISRLTLTRVSNVPGYNTNTHLISALCDYFEIEPGELLKKGVTFGRELGTTEILGFASRDFHLR